MLPLPGEALWGALSANDKAHMAVENGSHVAAVLRVFNGGEEDACAAYDAQHGEERGAASWIPTASRSCERTGSTTPHSARSRDASAGPHAPHHR